MRLNISMLRDFLKCPQLAYNAHVLRRGSSKKSVALEVGTLFHEAMAARLKGGTVIKLDVDQEVRDAWEKYRLWLPVAAFTPDPTWEIISVEQALEADIGNGNVLEGRLDALIKWNGKFWSLQWKTYEDDLLGLQERVRLSWHEVGYQWLAESNGYKPWGGTILGACQKLPGYRMTAGDSGRKVRYNITDQDRINALTLHHLFRAPETQTAMLIDLIESLSMAARELQPHGWRIGTTTSQPRRNYDSCFNQWGRKCPYFGVCHEGESLESGAFVDLEDRYAGG